MPVVVAVALRYIIISAIQLGIWALIEKYALPLLNKAIVEIMTFFGVSEETAKDIMANEIIRAAESIGVFAATLRTKLPIKVAEYLGFTTKGYARRSLSTTVTSKLSSTATPSIANRALTAAEAGTVATSIAEAQKVSGSVVKLTLDNILKWGTLATLVSMNLLNFLDFGNWNSGAYQNLMQKVIAFLSFGAITPDTPLPSSSVLSSDTWQRLYATYQEAGVVGINDPYKLQSIPFSRQALIDLVDRVAADQQIQGKPATIRNVLAWTNAFMVFKSGSGTSPSFSPTTAAGSLPVLSTGTPTQIKVYTGVVANGTLGLPAEFIARPDDMIEDTDELKAAAKNNLASFVQALPGRFYYELGIVNTVKTKGGFSQKGGAVRVVSGYNKDGSPRYKTVYHKFAVLRVGVTDENGRTVKLGSITLGPVNVVTYQPTGEQLRVIENSITPELFTSDINEVREVSSPQPVTVSQPPPPTIVSPIPTSQNAPQSTAQVLPDTSLVVLPVTIHTPSSGLFRTAGGYGNEIYRQLDSGALTVLNLISGGPPLWASSSEMTSYGNAGQQAAEAVRRLRDRYGLDYYNLPIVNLADLYSSMARRGLGYNDAEGSYHPPQTMAQDFDSFIKTSFATLTPQQINTTPGARINTSAAVLQATNLSEYYAAVGQSLPPIAQRATQYETAGLGAASTYVGTAEQNNRLLGYLKAHT